MKFFKKYEDFFEAKNYEGVIYFNITEHLIIANNVLYKDFEKVADLNLVRCSETANKKFHLEVALNEASLLDTSIEWGKKIAQFGWDAVKPPMSENPNDFPKGTSAWSHYLLGITSLLLTLTGIAIPIAIGIDVLDGAIFFTEGCFKLNSSDYFNGGLDIIIGMVTISLSAGSRAAIAPAKKGAETFWKKMGTKAKSIKDVFKVILDYLAKLTKKPVKTLLALFESAVSKIGQARKFIVDKVSHFVNVKVGKMVNSLFDVIIKKFTEFFQKIKGFFIQTEAQELRGALAKFFGDDVVISMSKKLSSKEVIKLNLFSDALTKASKTGDLSYLKGIFTEDNVINLIKKTVSLSDKEMKTIGRLAEKKNIAEFLIKSDAQTIKKLSNLGEKGIKKLDEIGAGMKYDDFVKNLNLIIKGEIGRASKTMQQLLADVAIKDDIGFKYVSTFFEKNPKLTNIGDFLKSKSFTALTTTEKGYVKRFLSKNILPEAVTDIKKFKIKDFNYLNSLFEKNGKAVLYVNGKKYGKAAFQNLMNSESFKKMASKEFFLFELRRINMDYEKDVDELVKTLSLPTEEAGGEVSGEATGEAETGTEFYFINDVEYLNTQNFENFKHLGTDETDSRVQEFKSKMINMKWLTDAFFKDGKLQPFIKDKKYDSGREKREYILPDDKTEYEFEVNDINDQKFRNWIMLLQKRVNILLLTKKIEGETLSIDGLLGKKTLDGIRKAVDYYTNSYDGDNKESIQKKAAEFAAEMKSLEGFWTA